MAGTEVNIGFTILLLFLILICLQTFKSSQLNFFFCLWAKLGKIAWSKIKFHLSIRQDFKSLKLLKRESKTRESVILFTLLIFKNFKKKFVFICFGATLTPLRSIYYSPISYLWYIGKTIGRIYLSTLLHSRVNH